MSFRIININNEQEWNNFRGTGLGASEISTLLNLNPYKSALELFYDKVGFKPSDYINLLMLGGKTTEEFTSSIFQAYNNGTPADTARNIQNGLFYRTCKKLPQHAFIQNDEWLNLFVSPDREFSDPKKNIISAALEIKDISGMELKNYVYGYVPSHFIQLKTQMAVWEKDYGALAYLIDRGRDYKEFYFKRDGIIWHDEYTGITTTEDDLKVIINEFWERVILAREATHKKFQAERNYNMEAASQYQMVIDQCEPKPDTSLAFENYIKENWYSISKPIIEIQGTQEHIDAAKKYVELKKLYNLAKENYQLKKNNILNICKQGHAIKFPGGYIEVNKTKLGSSIKIKI